MLFAPRTAVVVAAALTAFSLVACGQAAPGGGGDDERIDESSSALTANDKTAFDYFLAKGLTPIQAAGIVGNLDQESNMNPGAVQPGGPGRGIAQWSVGGRWNSDAGDNAVAYAAAHGKSVTSLGLQLDFIWFELTTFPSYGLSSLKKSTTVSAATLAFMTDFEACGTCLSSQRISYAQTALSAYGKDVVDAGSDAAKAPDASKKDGSSPASGQDSGATEPGDPVEPGAEDAGVGTTSATHQTNGAELPPEDLGGDQGGCSVARASGSGSDSHSGLGGTWLVSMCAAAALVLRRRREERARRG